MEKNGTWLGITKSGRFAALTNYRHPEHMQAKKTSRGQIVSDYLTGKMTPEQYIHTIQDKQNEYSGFNLLLGNPNHMLYYNNIDNQMRKIPVGTHSLSNHFLNTSWPKVRKGKSLLHDYVTKQEKIDPEVLFSILTDREIARDEDLPDTGVDLLLERQLSPLFIHYTDYGTRCSTVLLITKTGDVTFIERTFKAGHFSAEQAYSFSIENL